MRSTAMSIAAGHRIRRRIHVHRSIVRTIFSRRWATSFREFLCERYELRAWRSLAFTFVAIWSCGVFLIVLQVVDDAGVNSLLREAIHTRVMSLSARQCLEGAFGRSYSVGARREGCPIAIAVSAAGGFQFFSIGFRPNLGHLVRNWLWWLFSASWPGARGPLQNGLFDGISAQFKPFAE